MAIRLTVAGVEYTVDRPDEAAELLRHFGSPKKNGMRPKSKVPMSKAVQALYETEKGLDKPGLAKALGMAETQIPPLFNHARRWVDQVAPKGTDYDDIIVRTVKLGTEGGSLWKLTKKGRELVERVQSSLEE